MTLRGQVALVTGAGTRLGRSIALALGVQGMRVAVHYQSNRRGALAVCQELREAGGEAHPFAADLSLGPPARALVDQVLSHFGELHLLVSSAANFERIPFEQLDENAWDRALDLNARAGFILSQQAAPALRRSSGSIVFITCSSTLEPMRNYLPYVVSKAALLQLARTLALELAPEVRVNAVAPGTVLPPESMTPEQRDRLLRQIPLQRFGDSEEIARAVVFLAEGPFTTGQQLVVDGGRSVGTGAPGPPNPSAR